MHETVNEHMTEHMTEQQRLARPLAEVDPEIFELIGKETSRQNSRLELIASENFTSEAILEATGSVFTNKYAEGYPGKRYYGGCEWTDQVENLARDRAKKLFRAEYANVQPHSGSQANIGAQTRIGSVERAKIVDGRVGRARYLGRCRRARGQKVDAIEVTIAAFVQLGIAGLIVSGRRSRREIRGDDQTRARIAAVDR